MVNFTPAITNPVPGDAIEVKLANTITGASTISSQFAGSRSAHAAERCATQSGDGVAGQIALLIYRDNNSWQFDSIIPQAFSGIGMSVGMLVLALGNAAPPNTVKANGATVAIAQHPLLWQYAANSGRMVAEGDWVN